MVLVAVVLGVNNICTVVVPAFVFNLVSSGRMVVVRCLVYANFNSMTADSWRLVLLFVAYGYISVHSCCSIYLDA